MSYSKKDDQLYMLSKRVESLETLFRSTDEYLNREDSFLRSMVHVIGEQNMIFAKFRTFLDSLSLELLELYNLNARFFQQCCEGENYQPAQFDWLMTYFSYSRDSLLKIWVLVDLLNGELNDVYGES